MIVTCPRCALALDVGERAPGTVVRCRCTATLTVPVPPTSAGGLRCPACGAQAAAGANACAYCHAGLATLLCPRCFARGFLGATSCSSCGATLPRAAETLEPSTLACPVCPRTLLVRRAAEGYGLDSCERCGGLFLDLETQRQLFAARPRMPEGTAGTGVLPAPAPSGPVRYRRCPRCTEVMNRKNFGRNSGVILDVCARHGTWFDKDELRQAIAFVESGGLERAQRREVDDLREEARRARSERNVAALPLTAEGEASAASASVIAAALAWLFFD